MFIGSTQSQFAQQAGSTRRPSGAREQVKAGTTPEARHGKAREAATRVSLSEEAKKELRDELSPEEKQDVEKLKARDAEVRAHENAHLAAAGGFAKGGIKYEYQRGPDNQQYAVGGHVEIDTSKVPGDPTRSIQKAETVRRAALAPADPSGADRQVAARASRTMTNARAELAAEKVEEREEVKTEDAEDADHEGLAPNSRHSEGASSVSRRYAMAAYSSFAA